MKRLIEDFQVYFTNNILISTISNDKIKVTLKYFGFFKINGNKFNISTNIPTPKFKALIIVFLISCSEDLNLPAFLGLLIGGTIPCLKFHNLY